MRVDENKNRIYLSFTGSWIYLQEAPFYITHLKEALSLVKPGFSILTDIRELEEYSPEVLQMHVSAQKLTLDAGLSQLVEIHDSSLLASKQAVTLAEESAIPLNIFDNLEDAEDWLSQLSKR